MRTIVAIALSLLLGANAFAQDKAVVAALQGLDVKILKPDSADAKLRSDALKQLRDDVNKRDVEAWRSIKTKADWEKLRDERIAELRKSLGNFPPVPKQVKVITTKTMPADGCTIENILYESRPDFYVTANLYVPEKISKPMPGFIVIHSHHNPKTQSELQDMGMLWARQGCLVLIPDMLGHGERRQHPFTDAKTYPEAFKVGRQDYYFRYNNALQLHLVGESLMGWMVWDLMRGVDVLFQRPNLDKSKIMVFGSVAGGGDPCAVFAALEPRVTASAPFNFGGPQPETGKLGDDAELAFNYMGGGSWESTRGLRTSAKGGFLPWLIVGSVAPRGLVYGHEFAWDDQRDPVWTRFNKIWSFYDAKDKLASSKGRGSVKGTAPESTHCNNIGFEHRKPIYPTLNKWFDLPIPEENKKRFDSSELRCWTDEAKRTLNPKSMREVASAMVKTPTGAATTDAWIKLLGVSEKVAETLRKPVLTRSDFKQVAFDSAGARLPFPLSQIVIRRNAEPKLAVPMVLIRPKANADTPRVVIGIAQEGKAGFLKNRTETIAELLKRNVAVCLPDLRGSGETGAEGRGRTSGGTSYSAALQMHGQTVAGQQLVDLVAVMKFMEGEGFTSIALWGDSFAEPNDPKTNFAVPHDAGKMPRQSEPMGGLLAQLGGVFGGDKVKAIYIRGGLVSFRTLIENPFCYAPHDAVIPGVLTVGDLDTLAAANAKRNVRLEALVDGLNQRVDIRWLGNMYRDAGANVSEVASPPAEVAAWLSGK